MPALYAVTGKSAGDQISSTYEGRYLSLEEGLLVHPYHAADGLVDKGDPCMRRDGGIVGVALESATTASDFITIDTEGIFALKVFGCISDGTANGAAVAMYAGDPVYIKKVPGTDIVILSGQADPAHYTHFGYLVGDVTADLEAGTPDLVAVKVHGQASELHNIFKYGSYMGVFGNNMEIDAVAAKATGQLEPSALAIFCKLSSVMAASGDRVHGIKIRLEDTLAATGGDLQALRLQCHCNNANGVWTRLYGAYIAIANTASSAISESIGLAIAMGGGGAAPAMQTAIQIMGDGTLGEGVVYEALNMASLFKAPVLYVVENNHIAQTTPTELALAGAISDRFQAFRIPISELDTSDVLPISRAAEGLIAEIRRDQAPRALILNTQRFGPHSKGDDTRPAEAIQRLRLERDPLVIHAQQLDAQERAIIESRVNDEVTQAYNQALADPYPAPTQDPGIAEPLE
jgi:hypothetical protein